jgi:hypothetical protein
MGGWKVKVDSQKEFTKDITTTRKVRELHEILHDFTVNQHARRRFMTDQPRVNEFYGARSALQIGSHRTGVEQIPPHRSSMGGVGLLAWRM